VVVDLRDKYIRKDDALGIFMIIQRLFADVRSDGTAFNKLIVFDEAHNYMGTDFVDDILSAIRLMRHKGNSIVLASQDPESVPQKVIELSSVVILHKMSSPNWLRHIKKSLAALDDLQPGSLNMLRSGEAWIWASRSNRIQLQERANKAEMRPRVTQHGGESRKAVS
jgi:DNA phosphorothioation-dependent restriction protein DptH